MLIKSIKKYKAILYDALEGRKYTNVLSKKINLYLIVLIIISILISAISTVQELHANYRFVFLILDFFILTLFIAEYLTRLYVINVSSKYKGVILGRLKYALTPMAILDLLVILVSFFSMSQSGIFIARILRLLKIVRLFHAFSKTTTFTILKKVIDNEKHVLSLIAMFCVLLVVGSSSIVYMLEHSVQPEVFSSIPKAMWWSVITFTTVGYGDMYPITALGRALTSFIAFIGLASFSIPTTILTAGFITEARKLKEEKEQKCPHCGKNIPTREQ